MINDLYSHNQAPALEILEGFKNGIKSILYTSGVGCGKTYVARAIIEELSPKKIAYIVPKHAIKEDLHIRTDITQNIDIDFKTYNSFYDKTESVNVLSEYELVIIDEAHHLGSDIYGNNLVYAISQLKNTLFLGLTATPVREDKVNVGCFFGKTVEGISVLEAQRIGLMPPFEYIVCNPNLSKIKRNNIRKLKVEIDYNSSEELLKDIIDTNREKDKWIIYFSSVSDMDKKEQLFKSLFPDYEILKLSSMEKNLEEAMSLMYSDKKCVIMSVSILLEGVHAPTVGGIILCRNVKSLPVFDQILGRVSRIGATESPVIIDCTNTAYRMRRKLTKADDEFFKSDYQRFGVGLGTAHSSVFVSLENAKYISIADILETYKDKKTVLDYSFRSDSDLSRQLKKNPTYVSKYRTQGMSYEEVIEFATKDNSQSVLGYTFSDLRDLSRQLGKHKGFVSSHMKKGETIEEIITSVTTDNSRTILGYTFNSNADLSRQLGMNISYVGIYLAKGLTYEEIIKKVKDTDLNKQTVLGYTFKSNIDLSRQLGKKDYYVTQARKEGKSYEDIIKFATKDSTKTVLGYTFKSDVDLSRQLGKSKGYVSYHRITNKLSYEKIIEQVKEELEFPMTVMGYTFISDRDLSRQLNRHDSYVGHFRKKGVSYEDIISKVSINTTQTVLGYTFKSDRDLSIQLGVNKSYVGDKRKKGKTYEEIISLAKQIKK